MAKPRTVIDSYTGEEWQEPYVSPIPGIMTGRQNFYKAGTKGGSQVGYSIQPVPSPDPSLTPDPGAAPSWQLRRMACELFPAQELLTFPSYEQASQAARWCLRNDSSVQIAMYWLTKKDIEPFLRLLEALKDVAE